MHTLPKVVIGPPNDAQVEALLAAPAEWPTGYAAVEAILRADLALASSSDEDVRRMFDGMRAQGFGLEMEVGAVKPWSTDGTRTFELMAPNWRRCLDLGAPWISIAMDEPWGCARSLNIPDSEAVSQTADFVALVHRNFPEILVGDIEPYPVFPADEHIAWVHDLNAALEQRGTRRLDFYRIDPNYAAFDHFGRGWPGAVEVERDCRANGLPFSMIYWASGVPSAESGEPIKRDEWSRAVIGQAGEYLAAGGAPDQMDVQSWIGWPEDPLPEIDMPSFAGSLYGVLRQLGRCG
jgi:hypothetical protein